MLAHPILEGTEVVFVPVSAVSGDNVICADAVSSWYTGPSLWEVVSTFTQSPPARFLDDMTRIAVYQIHGKFYQKSRVPGDFLLFGKVMSGVVRTNTELRMFYLGIKTSLITIQAFGKSV
jgi:translation elongation factor EF-1alpha